MNIFPQVHKNEEIREEYVHYKSCMSFTEADDLSEVKLLL